jgi:hypothetical protein
MRARGHTQADVITAQYDEHYITVDLPGILNKKTRCHRRFDLNAE